MSVGRYTRNTAYYRCSAHNYPFCCDYNSKEIIKIYKLKVKSQFIMAVYLHYNVTSSIFSCLCIQFSSRYQRERSVSTLDRLKDCQLMQELVKKVTPKLTISILFCLIELSFVMQIIQVIFQYIWQPVISFIYDRSEQNFGGR